MQPASVISSISLLRIRAVCLGKVKFPSPEIAWYVMDYTYRNRHFSQCEDYSSFETYLCPYCNKYHLGNSTKKTKKKSPISGASLHTP